jgi:hypothetical protein
MGIHGYLLTHLKVDVTVFIRGGYGLNPLPQPDVPLVTLLILSYYTASKQKRKLGYERTKVYVERKTGF